jgi:hypothetical protein
MWRQEQTQMNAILDHNGFDITARGPKIGLAPIAPSTGKTITKTEFGAPHCCRCYKLDQDDVTMEKKKLLHICPRCRHQACILCKREKIVKKWYNPLNQAWQDTPPPSLRIASDAQGNPLTFAEKAQPRKLPPAPVKLSAADIAVLHGCETMRRIRGA